MGEEEEAEPPTAAHPALPGISYHFAMGGKSFAVLLDHFPDLLPKVRPGQGRGRRGGGTGVWACPPSSQSSCFVLTVVALRHHLRPHGPRPEDAAGGSPAENGVRLWGGGGWSQRSLSSAVPLLTQMFVAATAWACAEMAPTTAG